MVCADADPPPTLAIGANSDGTATWTGVVGSIAPDLGPVPIEFSFQPCQFFAGDPLPTHAFTTTRDTVATSTVAFVLNGQLCDTTFPPRLDLAVGSEIEIAVEGGGFSDYRSVLLRDSRGLILAFASAPGGLEEAELGFSVSRGADSASSRATSCGQQIESTLDVTPLDGVVRTLQPHETTVIPTADGDLTVAYLGGYRIGSDWRCTDPFTPLVWMAWRDAGD